jgi:hypothetical protein
MGMEWQQEMNRQNIPYGDNGKSGAGDESFEGQQISVESLAKETLAQDLMTVVCSKSNLNRAYKRVKSNKGAAGVDGMTVSELGSYIREHKEEIITSLKEGRYLLGLAKRIGSAQLRSLSPNNTLTKQLFLRLIFL